MKKSTLIFMIACILTAIYHAWYSLREHLLGIEMALDDYSMWVHNDLQALHDHLDDEITTEDIEEIGDKVDIKWENNSLEGLDIETAFINGKGFVPKDRENGK